MAEGLRLPVYSLLLGLLLLLYVYWEASLQIPVYLLTGVHVIYVVSNFSRAHPAVRTGRKICVCLILTFADSVFTSYALRIPLSPMFSYLVLEFFCIFFLLHRLHPKEQLTELRLPLVRGGVYMTVGFYMALGVAGGFQEALHTVSILTVAHATFIVVGKHVLTSLIYLLDEFFCEAKPVKMIKAGDVVFDLKAGVAVFLFLGLVTLVAPPSTLEFTWCTYASAIVYLVLAAFETISHEPTYETKTD